MNKKTQRQKLREKVFEKFNGRCAYSGAVLPDNWEIDHLEPFPRGQKGIKVIQSNRLENLMPTFKFVNMFKRSRGMEEWRQYLIDFNKKAFRYKKDGKDVRVRAKHKNALLQIFGMSKTTPFSGVFYFETTKCNCTSISDDLVLDGEVWLPVEKYKSYYEASNFGRIRCVLRVDNKGQTRKNIIKKQQVSREGHLTTLFSVDKTRRTERVAFVIAELFVPNPLGHKYISYINGDKMDCRSENLIWTKRKFYHKSELFKIHQLA